MNVKEPARAPTTPPDMGASRKDAAFELLSDTDFATARDVIGSMVEQSMKSRWVEEDGVIGRGEVRIDLKTDLT